MGFQAFEFKDIGSNVFHFHNFHQFVYLCLSYADRHNACLILPISKIIPWFDNLQNWHNVSQSYMVYPMRQNIKSNRMLGYYLGVTYRQSSVILKMLLLQIYTTGTKISMLLVKNFCSIIIKVDQCY